jgi:riboflavin synthase
VLLRPGRMAGGEGVMFTGIIEDIGTVKALGRQRDSLQLKLESRLPPDELKLGDSLAVNGVCLTLTEISAGLLVVDLSHETLATTTLKDLKPGGRVHLERALTFGGRLGGHLVTGHVDGVGEVVSRTPKGPNLDLVFLAPAEVIPYLIPKGSVAVDGVSLTVNQPSGQRFQVTLVPHTLKQTTLSELRVGDRVNLEADLLGKYVKHLVSGGSGKGIDEEFLAQHGFLDKDPAKP